MSIAALVYSSIWLSRVFGSINAFDDLLISYKDVCTDHDKQKLHREQQCSVDSWHDPWRGVHAFLKMRDEAKEVQPFGQVAKILS